MGAARRCWRSAPGLRSTLPKVTREFVTLTGPDGTDLYAQLVKPEGFDPAKKYPVVVHWYGGPGLQMVSNRYGTTNIFNIIERDVLYTQAGFLVWRLDNRGSFGRGHAFEAPIFGELGKVALEDQLAGIEYLRTLPYVNANRIGTDGKSFGGYMTLYALIHAPDVFRCGVAGAAPTDWSYYDTIYTERYMRTPATNAEGYAATNLIDRAGQIQAAAAADPRPGRHQRPPAEHGELHRGVGGQRQAVRFCPPAESIYRGRFAAAAVAAADTATPASGAGLANPASQNCADQGGVLIFEERGDGGQFGVCTFEDNMQCEEWALMRGECPVGGVKVTGYVTPAAIYCAITGGAYAVTGEGGADDEQGTCTFKDGAMCDAADYYNGKCDPSTANVAPTTTIQPLSMEVCNGQAQAMAHALDVLEVTQAESPLNDPVIGATGMGCEATVAGTGEQFTSPDEVVNALGRMLEGQGWTQAPMLAAGGPTGIGQGYRKADQICMVTAQWWPDDSANCPKDQPVSACEVTPDQQIYTVTLNCGVETS